MLFPCNLRQGTLGWKARILFECVTKLSCRKTLLVVSKSFWLGTSVGLKQEKNGNCHSNSQDVIAEVLKWTVCIKLQTSIPTPKLTKKISEKRLQSEPSAWPRFKGLRTLWPGRAGPGLAPVFRPDCWRPLAQLLTPGAHSVDLSLTASESTPGSISCYFRAPCHLITPTRSPVPQMRAV